MDGVQRWVVCFVLNKHHYTDSFDDMLCTLNWLSLEQQWKTACLAMFFKVIIRQAIVTSREFNS